MTSIATKSGSVVIKGSSIGSNCGCCATGACLNSTAGGTECTIASQSACEEAGKTFQGADSTCGPDVNACCPSGTRWHAVLYVRCTDSPFSPCFLATEDYCGCDKLYWDSGFAKTTYATWVTDGRRGRACAVTQLCGSFATESDCKSYANYITGTSTGISLACGGRVPWGNGPFSTSGGVDGTGYKSQYDCIECTPNPLP